MTTLVAPSADPVAEGARIAELAQEDGLDLRLVGGVGVALRCPSAASPALRRAYKDVTFARVFDSGTAVVLEAVSHGEDDETLDVA